MISTTSTLLQIGIFQLQFAAEAAGLGSYTHFPSSVQSVKERHYKHCMSITEL